ncbi:hypothetical protein [Sphingomonas sp. Leaf17]|uniref:hypothetical protein n=1 Tax=Sphingomonas sp. Leaf17 TaxID=1735683 RepID=UPI0012E141E4|nr:hypothetical protein [Sphingomonas sp. Leaf17]
MSASDLSRDNIARVLAKADGLDWDEACLFEVSDVCGCDSSTCIGAHYEDHQPEIARAAYRRQADAVLGLIAGKPVASVERPDSDALDEYLPEAINGAKRCGIQRSDWLTGWYVPWSPRNDNQNAEGPWSDWVDLARAILKADAEALGRHAQGSVA